MSLYATDGARLVSVTRDGKPIDATTDTELGHPIVDVDVQLAPGATTTLVYRLDEPRVRGTAQTVVQPLVRPLRETIRTSGC